MSNKNKLSGDRKEKSSSLNGEETRSLFDFCKGLQEEEDKSETLPLLFQLELSVKSLNDTGREELRLLLEKSPLYAGDQEQLALVSMLAQTDELMSQTEDAAAQRRLAELMDAGLNRTDQYLRLSRPELDLEQIERLAFSHCRSISDIQDENVRYFCPPKSSRVLEFRRARRQSSSEQRRVVYWSSIPPDLYQRLAQYRQKVQAIRATPDSSL